MYALERYEGEITCLSSVRFASAHSLTRFTAIVEQAETLEFPTKPMGKEQLTLGNLRAIVQAHRTHALAEKERKMMRKGGSSSTPSREEAERFGNLKLDSSLTGSYRICLIVQMYTTDPRPFIQ